MLKHPLTSVFFPWPFFRSPSSTRTFTSSFSSISSSSFIFSFFLIFSFSFSSLSSSLSFLYSILTYHFRFRCRRHSTSCSVIFPLTSSLSSPITASQLEGFIFSLPPAHSVLSSLYLVQLYHSMSLSVCRGNSFGSGLHSVVRPTIIPSSASRAVRFVDPFGSSDEEAEQSSEDDDRLGFLAGRHINSNRTLTQRQDRSRTKASHSRRSSTEISLGDLLRKLDRMGYEPTSPSNSPPRSSRSSFSTSSSINSSSSSSVSSVSSGSSGSPSTSNPLNTLYSAHLSGSFSAPHSDDQFSLGSSHTDPRPRSVSPVLATSVEPAPSPVLPPASDPFEMTSLPGLHTNKNRPKGRSMSISILPVLHEHVDEKPDGRSCSLLTPGDRLADHNPKIKDDWETDRKRKRRCSAEGRLEVLKEEREEAL